MAHVADALVPKLDEVLHGPPLSSCTMLVGLEDVGDALELAQSPAALKVLVTPGLQGERQ
jgi:hypothetical protein